MKQCPEIAVPFQYNMAASASITTVRPTKRSKFIAHKMFATRSSMAASAKDPYLVDEIAFFQCFNFATFGKYNLSMVQMILLKYFLLLVAIPVVIDNQCTKKEIGIPSCIQQKI